MSFYIILLTIIFLTGIYFCFNMSSKEHFISGKKKYRCPNILIQKGSSFFLYNSKIDKVPGVNPIQFDNLEDYTEFIEWQKSQNINCPVLFLQQSYDTQGNRIFKLRPSVYDLNSGLTPSLATGNINNTEIVNKIIHSDFSLFNTSNNRSNIQLLEPPSIDNTQFLVNNNKDLLLTNFNTGKNIIEYPGHYEDILYDDVAPIDGIKIQQELAKLEVSPDPMDSNWGGPKYTRKLVEQGYYDDNQIYKI